MLKNKKTLILIICLFAFIMVVGGVSYSYFTYNKEVVTATVESGSINIDFTNSSNSLNLSSVAPMRDEIGKISTNYIDFTVSGTADVEAIMYEIEVTNSNSNLDNYLKLYLTDQNNVEVTSPFLYSELYDAIISGRKGIYQDFVEGNQDGTSKATTRNYRLRVWIDESYTTTTSVSSNISVYLYGVNKDTTNVHRLVFDTNDGRTLSKLVNEGEEYGTLPTPYKEGYTFLGWNGKNLFDKDNYDNDHYLKQKTGALHNDSGSDRLDDWACTDYINVKPSTNYIKSGTIGGVTTSLFDIDQNVISVSNVASGTSFSTANNTSYVKFNLNRSNSPYSDVQLEEGSIVTPYEPYYVTSSTIVTTRNTNYVLTVKWERDEKVENVSFNNYQEVEYIEGTGTQFINTEVLGNNNNLSFDIEYSWTELPASGVYKNVFSAYSSEDDKTTRIIQYGISRTYFNNNSKADGSPYLNLSRSVNTIYHDTLSANINNQFTYTSNGNISIGSFTQGNNVANNIFVFGSMNVKNDSKAHIKLYSFKIWDNNVLIRNFVPMYRKRDGEIGLYDRVNNVFYQNAGTDDFVKGPNV